MVLNERTESTVEIGGYFGLDLPEYEDLYADAIRFQSGRASIRAVLECSNAAKVLMPAYICDSIIRAAVDAGVEVETYDLDEALYPVGLPEYLPDQCMVLYVNYFGLCQKNIFRLLKSFPNERIIIDNSHALFSAHTSALATIYSPRKFVGLPDGGLVKHSAMLNMPVPLEDDVGSLERMKYLLIRMSYSAREGYGEFDAARNSLFDSRPLAMSKLTQRLMKSINWKQVIEQRRENYTVMAEIMGGINEISWSIGKDDVPLCYPLVLSGCDINKIKVELAILNIFTATYWVDALPRAKENSIELTLINQTLFLPIDQRMKAAQVKMVGELVMNLINDFRY